MSLLDKLANLLPSRRRPLEEDMRRELEALAGIAEAEGDLPALGSLARAAEEARTVWTWTTVEQFFRDIHYAARTVRRSPGFAATAVALLALGIGSNTAIFSLMNAILLRSLPVNHPESLVMLSSFAREGRVGDFGYQDYLPVRDANRAFSGVLAASSQNRVPVDDGSQAALAKMVSSNYFSVLGVQPQLGRGFVAGDDAQPLAVIGDGYWKRSLGGAVSAVGKDIDLEGVPFTIVGIAPPGFRGETVGEAPDIWTTVSLMPENMRYAPGFTWLNLMGRLRPGVATAQASADLARLLPLLPSSDKQGGFIERIAVENGQRGSSSLRDTFSAPLGVLMAVVAAVLLIACVNLAGLQMARASARQREIATRLALGAGKWRIVRQLMAESLLLALAGGALGLVFAIWSERLLLALVAGVGRTITVDLQPDLRVLAFTAAITAATGILFGLAPAIQAVGQRRLVPLRRGQSRLRGGLMALQVALSLLLLVTGGLFIRTLTNLKGQDLGFRAENVVSAQIAAERAYSPQWASFSQRVLARVRAIPGVQAASVSRNATLAKDGSGVNGLVFENAAPRESFAANWVGPDYFRTSGIQLLEGRDFSAADDADAPMVAMINRTMARRFFPGRSAVGGRFDLVGKHYQVIGVAADAKYRDLREQETPVVYFAALQNNAEIHSLEIRSTVSAAGLAGAVRAAVRETDPRLRVDEITTVEKRIEERLAPERLIADLAGFFSASTLLLVAIGVYGTLSYSVARRTNEIGIRMALGAQVGAVVRMVLRDVAAALACGLVAGLAGALVCGRLVRSLLFGVTASDPWTIAFAVAVLAAATVAAAYLPARRAARVDPAAALRFE